MNILEQIQEHLLIKIISKEETAEEAYAAIKIILHSFKDAEISLLVRMPPSDFLKNLESEWKKQ